MLRLIVVAVNWNVRDLLRTCLRSVVADLASLESAECRVSSVERVEPSTIQQSGLSSEIIVVDNASGDGSVEMVRTEFPEVRLVANQANVGFGAANNQALQLADGEYVLFLNPDTEVRPGALHRLVRFLDSHPEAGCVGPKLLNPDGTVQPSRRTFPRLAAAFVESTVLQRYLGGLPAVRQFYLADRGDGEAQEVDWVVGACMLVRRCVLGQVGAFDERFFMYSEEMDLCYRMKQAGWQVWYLPEAEIVHHEAASSRQDLFRQNVSFHESRYRFFRKHHGIAGALALRWFTFLTYLFQTAEEAGKFLLQPAKRDLRRQRLRLYRRVIAWYLSAS